MELRESLLGTWVTPGGLTSPRSTEWGPTLFEITFMPDGMMTLTMTSISPTGELDPNVSSGPYQVIAQQLVTELINKGEPVRLERKGSRLFLYIQNEEQAAEENVEWVRK